MEPRPQRGAFDNGMEFVAWGEGPKTLLFIQGGPGSPLPAGLMLRMTQRLLAPYTSAGYTVWIVSRRRHMPAGYSITEIADDYARLIRERLDGRVDVLYGESYGGMIAQYLVARHPGVAGHVALAVAGCVLSPWGREVDARLESRLAQGDRVGAAAALAEWLLPNEGLGWLRRSIAPLMVRRLVGGGVPVEDVLVEVRTELSFDSRPILPHITVPVLLIAGDKDRGFPKEVVKETAALIPQATIVWHEGSGHAGTASSHRIPVEVLDFVRRAPSSRPGE